MTTTTEQTWTPVYSPWRHGGWYVDNLRYPSGAVGCVSRNYADKRWRIVCDDRPGSWPGGPDDHTYPSRDAAAEAERELALAPTRANASAALDELRRLRDMGALGYAANSFEHLDRMLSAGGPLPEAWQQAQDAAATAGGNQR